MKLQQIQPRLFVTNKTGEKGLLVLIEYIRRIEKELLGKTITIDKSKEISEFLGTSRKIANKEWIYHCTDTNALISILKNKEFYLKNLVYVNDEDEVKAIDVNAYRNTFYVGCFSSEIIDSDEHREEYGKSENSVFIAMKKEWFTKNVHFLCIGDGEWIDLGDTFRIFSNLREVIGFQKNEYKDGRYCYPYYIEDYDFYGVIYDDNEQIRIQCDISIASNGTEIKGVTFIPELAGIIKKKSGISKRTKEYRIWANEKEIRLKLCIHQEDHFLNGNEYHDGAMVPITIKQVVVQLTENAFDTLHIYFPDTFVDRDGYINKLKKEIPGIKISVMDKSGVL